MVDGGKHSLASASVFDDIRRFEQAGDNCNTTGAGRDDLLEGVDLNSADTKDRENYIAMDTLNLLQSDRLVIGFGRRRENRAEPKVIVAFALPCQGLIDA